MALATNSDLKAALANWLDRTDLANRIPEFIALAEARIRRRLRAVETLGTLSITDRDTALTNIAELQSIRLVTGNPRLDRPLTNVTKAVLDERAAEWGNATGRPLFYAVVNDTLYVAPTPDQTYTAEIVHYPALVALSGESDTNAVLTAAPDVYLYLALAAAEPYLKHDERLPMWKQLGEEAMQELERQLSRKKFHGGLTPARLPVVLG